MDGVYFEVYNNADTVIHLDGKVVGLGFGDLWDFAPERPCDAQAHLRLASDAVWSNLFEMFPGSGTDYPLEPGRTAVIALDAIDHRPFAPEALDLSGADFEFRGPADVDNPAVPDMINIGLGELPTGRGLRQLSGIVFLSEPVDVDALSRSHRVGGGREYAAIPAENILDVVSYISTYDDMQFPLCPQVIHRDFDRRWFEQKLTDTYRHLSIHRRPLLRLSDGRVLLQRTGSSYADFVEAPYRPGAVLEP